MKRRVFAFISDDNVIGYKYADHFKIEEIPKDNFEIIEMDEETASLLFEKYFYKDKQVYQ